MRTFLALTRDHHTAVDRNDLLHAVPTKALFRRPKRRKTVDSVCGKRVVPVAGVCAVKDEGEAHMYLMWPPYARSEGGRCTVCFEATGRPRPVADHWENPATSGGPT